MTRAQAISIITARIAELDDEAVQAVADLVQSMPHAEPPLRALSDRERTLLARSKADFAAGRSYSHEEMVAMIDERLALHGVPKSTE